MAVLWISIGAALGANLRYAVGQLFARSTLTPPPLATVVVNVSGSFLLGLFMGFALQNFQLNPRWRLLVAVGFCGGYTTFSTFAWETIVLLGQRRWGMAALNVIGSNLACLIAGAAGAFAARGRLG